MGKMKIKMKTVIINFTIVKECKKRRERYEKKRYEDFSGSKSEIRVTGRLYWTGSRQGME